ncbi:MAG: helix-turn-helix transcriptional regulator [Candidatus Aminicenantaceae bacterium]
MTLKAKKPLPPGYPKLLKILGDHLRKKRLDLKLLQKEVAESIGVDEITIYYWENNRVKPSLPFIPKIIEFLGYIPFDTESNSLGEQIIIFRRIHGLSQKKLARFLGIDYTTIGHWERGEHWPSKKLFDKLISLFTSSSSSSGPEE